MEAGKLQFIGHETAETQKNQATPPETSTIFVRPHALDLSREPNGDNAIKSTVLHINPAGPTVKLELKSEWGDLIQATITQDKFKKLQIKPGMQVYVLPLDMHVFNR